MEKISFTYNGKMYQSILRVSTSREPQYYWCYLTETDLSKEIGECVLFLGSNGVFKTPHYYHIEHRNLIDSLEEAIKQYIAKN